MVIRSDAILLQSVELGGSIAVAKSKIGQAEMIELTRLPARKKRPPEVFQADAADQGYFLSRTNYDNTEVQVRDRLRI
jgi:hypothetical protein